MSSVTVVPASAAAAQIARAFSSASFSSKIWPRALSFTLTSAAGVSPAADSWPSSARYSSRVCSACFRIEGVFAEVVEGDPQTVVDQGASWSQRVFGAGAGDKTTYDVSGDRGRFHEPRDPG